MDKLYAKIRVSLTIPKLQLMCVLPYTDKSSLDLMFQTNDWEKYTICKLNIVFRSTCRLGNLFRFKDSLEKKILSGIVYRYTCSNYKVTYYVKAFQHFFTRASEHMESFRFPVVFACETLFLSNYAISSVHPLLCAALQPSFNLCYLPFMKLCSSRTLPSKD